MSALKPPSISVPSPSASSHPVDGLPTAADVVAAGRRLRSRVHCTPVVMSRTLNRLTGTELFFKCENLQRTGAFKFRGATNAAILLPAEAAARGVVTHSSGNHAAALALAAQERGIPAHLVIPRDAPPAKLDSARRYGGRIILCEPGLAAREAAAEAVARETGATLVHPFDDPAVIAGQGTAALEFLSEIARTGTALDLLVAPVGGGGLLSGTALAAEARAHRVAVWGAEPANADDAARSLEAGHRITTGNGTTIADGLRTALSTRTFALLRPRLAGIARVTDEEIAAAMRLAWETLKLVIEPSAAVPLAALLAGRIPAADRRVGIILSGGNVDLGRLPW